MQWLRVALTAMLFGLSVVPASAGMNLTSGSLSKRDGVYYFDARLAISLTPVARNALREGVPLVMALRLKVLRKRAWWPWHETVVERSKRYRLRYSALAERYRLTALDERRYRSFGSLAEMLREFSELPRLRVIDAQRLRPDQDYQLGFRAELDLAALPRPMRTLAYISPNWWLATDWRHWSLAP